MEASRPQRGAGVGTPAGVEHDEPEWDGILVAARVGWATARAAVDAGGRSATSAVTHQVIRSPGIRSDEVRSDGRVSRMVARLSSDALLQFRARGAASDTGDQCGTPGG